MMKRIVDIFFGSVSLALISPVFIMVAFLVKVGDGGPVFYASRRVGLNGKIFKLYKFRTMIVEADKIGKGITTASDVRITSVGALLRKYKIDEIPQLINVLIGDMSFVGPRPEDPRYVALYTPAQRTVLKIRPGITSPASIAYRHEERLLAGDDWEWRYINEILPAKLAIEQEYASHSTIATDLSIILKTLVAVVWYKGST